MACRRRRPGLVTVDATIDRVGADFVEVATHAAGEVRRRDEVREVELIPLRGRWPPVRRLSLRQRSARRASTNGCSAMNSRVCSYIREM